jgi:Tetratricopeptide repeat
MNLPSLRDRFDASVVQATKTFFLTGFGTRTTLAVSPSWASMLCLEQSAHLRTWRRLLPLIGGLLLPLVGARGQAVPTSGNDESLFRGDRAELAVTVKDNSGEAISAPAVVKLLRSGVPTNQAPTSKGKVSFILPGLGEYTVIVDAPGYTTQQKDISIPVNNRVELDVVLARAAGNEVAGVPGKPVLAPKAQQAFEKGLTALSQDKMKDAEKYVGEAVKLAPGHPDVLYAQGVLDLKQKNFPQAQEVLEKATQIDPSHARAFAALGMALEDQGKYDAAISPLETSLHLEPANWEAGWALGKAYYQHAQYEEALKTSQDALTASSGKAPEIELLVAQSLTAVGRYEDSAAALRDYLKNHGNRPEAATARKWLDRLNASGKIQKQ